MAAEATDNDDSITRKQFALRFKLFVSAIAAESTSRNTIIHFVVLLVLLSVIFVVINLEVLVFL